MAKDALYYQEVATREVLNRHGDCSYAHERNPWEKEKKRFHEVSDQPCIFCYIKMRRFSADELTECSNFVRSRFRTVEHGENPSYGRVRTPRHG